MQKMKDHDSLLLADEATRKEEYERLLAALHVQEKEEEAEQVPEKWYQNDAVQVIIGMVFFLCMTAVIAGLYMLFSDYLSRYWDKRTHIFLDITPHNIRATAHDLKSNSQSFSSDERDHANKLAQYLEGTANELNGSHQVLLKSFEYRIPLWLETALNQLSQKEVVGEEHNIKILNYINSTDPDASYFPLQDEFPWGSPFINWVMQQARIPGTNDEDAYSWLGWGETLDEPKPGAVAVFKVEGKQEKGYVGLFLSETANYVIVIGGDVGNAVRIISLKKSNLLGYRWPSNSQFPLVDPSTNPPTGSR